MTSRSVKFNAQIGLFLLLLVLSAVPATAEEHPYGLSIYGGRLVDDDWESLFDVKKESDFVDSYLLAVGLSKRVGGYRDMLSYEIEGQVVRHFDLQEHWEFNALAGLRWEKFWWDKTVDTSIAFGLGPSYATRTPKAEVLFEGDSQRWMVYWMMELALSLPETPAIALITRIHHRSEAFGLVADRGGANAVCLGVRYRF